MPIPNPHTHTHAWGIAAVFKSIHKLIGPLYTLHTQALHNVFRTIYMYFVLAIMFPPNVHVYIKVN